MWIRRGVTVLAASALWSIPHVVAQEPVDGFEAREASRSYPLVVYLHGGGGVGDDNLRQISGGNATGTHVWTEPEVQARHPSFVLAPQAGSRPWADHAEAVFELIASLMREFSLDENRVYLTGQSFGGAGTWAFVARRPDLFAAAVPLCDTGQPADAGAIRDLPVWVFHGADDATVPVERSRRMVGALRSVGGNVKYTEYPSVGHPVWLRAYREPDLVDWLFAQRRQR